MPTQRLSLFAPLQATHLEPFVSAVQTLTSDRLAQFKTLTRIYKDESSPQGHRPTDFLRISTKLPLEPLSSQSPAPAAGSTITQQPDPTSDGRDHLPPRDITGTTMTTTTTGTTPPPPPFTSTVIELVDAPEINNKRPLTSRIVHVVPCTHGDAATLALSMGYTPSYAYYEQGYSLLLGTTVMRIYRIFKAGRESNDMTTGEARGGGPGGGAGGGEEETLNGDGTAIGDGTTWIVQADLEIRTGSPEDLRKGTEELLRWKKEVQGHLELLPLVDELR